MVVVTGGVVLVVVGCCRRCDVSGDRRCEGIFELSLPLRSGFVIPTNSRVDTGKAEQSMRMVTLNRADAVRASWLGDTFLNDKVKLQNPPWARGGFEKLTPTPRKDVENTRRRRRQAVKVTSGIYSA